MKKIILPTILICSLAAGLVFAWLLWNNYNTQEKTIFTNERESNSINVRFAPAVEEVIHDKLDRASKALHDPEIISELKASNERNSSLSESDILKLDEAWRNTTGNDKLINSYLNNPVSLKLHEFQDDNDGFVEIFVTDAHGLNVGQTNRTSDLYQADEEWWVSTYANGDGKESHGGIEFDVSAQSEAISLYIPILDSNQKVIGVGKAVVDLTVVKAGL